MMMNPNPALVGSLPWRRFLSAFFFLFLEFLIPADCLNRDGLLLLSFKYSVVGDPLGILSSWNFNDDTPCNWRGVACDDSLRVVALSLPGSQLRGSIAPDIGFLDQLRAFNLSSNSFIGSVPADFFHATELREIDLSHNLLAGELSHEIGQLQNLQLLNLSNNGFSGELPSQLAWFGNLTVISVRSNNLSGEIPTGMDRVRVLDLSSNSINGSLRAEFGGQSIHYLNLSSNRISGEIPAGFGRNFPENSTLDFSYNNLTGSIPDSNLFLNQQTSSFSGNPGLCGDPLTNPCPIPSSPTSLPGNTFAPNSSPAIAAMPNNFNSSPAEGTAVSPPAPEGRSGMKPVTIAVIVAGDLAGIIILTLVLLLVYRFRRNRGDGNNDQTKDHVSATRTDRAWSSPSSSTSSETKGITNWSCLGKHRGATDADRSSSASEEQGMMMMMNPELTSSVQNAAVYSTQSQNDEHQGKLVTVDGETELEVETLLKASAYILGASGPTIIYKAVLEDGSALAVRRIGEGAADRLKDFENQLRAVAKVAAGHPNLVRIRGFYWGSDEKLIIYKFVPNGSLANARYRKGGSSPCPLPWEFRLKIAKGVARGLSYLHDKKHVHGNLKPSNILLDPDLEPKISDFGLDRLAPGLDASSGHKPAGFSARHFGSKRSTCSRDSFPDLQYPSPSPSPSSIGCGSPYSPPESLRSLKPNAKWDVYAFGVVLLELLTGKVVGPDDLATWVAGLTTGDDLDKARVLRMADLAIRADLEGLEEALLTCLKLGCSCAAPAPQKRPSMKEVLQVLEKLPLCSSPSPYF